MRSFSAPAQLQTLRNRLTLLLASLAALGVGLLATITTVVDSQLREGEEATYRQGLASRLAALVYPDDANQWITDGVVDDAAWQSADAVLVALRSGEVLYETGGFSDFESLLASGVSDEEEVGVAGTVTVDGDVRVASAAPFWDFETVEGVVIVTWIPGSDTDQQRLRLLVWGAAAALTLMSAAAAWFAAGKIVVPVSSALGREERFLSTAAHDIRTPLGRVRALAESALRTSDQLEPSPALRQLRSELHRLVGVAVEAADDANDLLLAGRIDSARLDVRRQPVRLDQVVADFESRFSELAVETFEPVTVAADPVLIGHAIANILNNAVQHGRRPGVPLLISAVVRNDGSDGVVTIADNGPGLGTHDGHSIFERYGSAGQASGLGLWIVRTIVVENGGSVTASDNNGGGCTFEVRLPLTNA